MGNIQPTKTTLDIERTLINTDMSSNSSYQETKRELEERIKENGVLRRKVALLRKEVKRIRAIKTR